MSEYIERERALDVIRRTSGDYAAAFSEIAHMPASDVAEVIHAHIVINWLGDCHCSNCGEYCDSSKEICASCGARLDEPEWREY